MAVVKRQVPDMLLRQLPTSQADRQEVVRLGLRRFLARRREKPRSVVDATFAALPLRKHAQIEQMIEQSKYGE